MKLKKSTAKQLIKVQSISDIITNSSSEVFLMNRKNAMEHFEGEHSEIDVDYISLGSLWSGDYAWIQEESDLELPFYDYEKYDGDFQKFVEDNRDKLEILESYAIVDISNHMDYDLFQEFKDEAYNFSKCHECR